MVCTIGCQIVEQHRSEYFTCALAISFTILGMLLPYGIGMICNEVKNEILFRVIFGTPGVLMIMAILCMPKQKETRDINPRRDKSEEQKFCEALKDRIGQVLTLSVIAGCVYFPIFGVANSMPRMAAGSVGSPFHTWDVSWRCFMAITLSILLCVLGILWVKWDISVKLLQCIGFGALCGFSG